jgi:hypothetical protein
MQTRHILTVAVATFALAACADNTPTAPATEPSVRTLEASAAAAAKNGQTATITGAVTGTATDLLGAVGTFTGTATVTSFAVNAAGDLVANVLVVGSATVGAITTPVSTTVATPVSNLGSCPVLDLDLGAIHLNLLGLVVDLSAVNLDIVAQSGAGALVGNLLCVVVHLLDGGAVLTAITNLLNLLNGLLA